MKKEINISLTTLCTLSVPVISGVFYAGVQLQDIKIALERLQVQGAQNTEYLMGHTETLGKLDVLVQTHKNTHIRYVHNTKKDVVMETPSGDRIVVPAIEVVKL